MPSVAYATGSRGYTEVLPEATKKGGLCRATFHSGQPGGKGKATVRLRLSDRGPTGQSHMATRQFGSCRPSDASLVPEKLVLLVQYVLLLQGFAN